MNRVDRCRPTSCIRSSCADVKHKGRLHTRSTNKKSKSGQRFYFADHTSRPTGLIILKGALQISRCSISSSVQQSQNSKPVARYFGIASVVKLAGAMCPDCLGRHQTDIIPAVIVRSRETSKDPPWDHRIPAQASCMQNKPSHLASLFEIEHVKGDSTTNKDYPSPTANTLRTMYDVL